MQTGIIYIIYGTVSNSNNQDFRKIPITSRMLPAKADNIPDFVIIMTCSRERSTGTESCKYPVQAQYGVPPLKLQFAAAETVQPTLQL